MGIGFVERQVAGKLGCAARRRRPLDAFGVERPHMGKGLRMGIAAFQRGI